MKNHHMVKDTFSLFYTYHTMDYDVILRQK